MANQPYLDVAHLHHKHFLVTLSSVGFFVGTYIMSNSLPYVVHRIAPMQARGGNQTCVSATCGHLSDWIWLMACVSHSNSTFNACI